MAFDIGDVVRSPLKRYLRRLFDRVARGSREFQQLQKRVRWLETAIFDLTPDVIPPSEAVRQAVADVLVENAIVPSRVNLSISKSDLMYQFILHLCETPEQAQESYIRSGLHMMQVLQTICRRKFSDLKNVSAFLDFASGYGRLTRFLIQMIDPAHIWISDIKPRAVQFQQQHFGVQGFVSSEKPDDLIVEHRFDCIFVGSLFSHLPEEAFGKWLQRLCDLLTGSGMLIFTVHDSCLLNRTSNNAVNGMTFFEESEEGMVRSTDKPLDTKQYGTSYVTEEFVQQAIQGLSFENKSYVRYRKGMWGLQDIYLLARDSDVDLSGLCLPTP